MSKNKLKIVIPCNEAGHVCDKAQYKEANLWEKIKLHIHLIYCRACKKYSKNNASLTLTIKEAKIACMDEAYKKAMKKNFDKAIKEQQL